jgi:hypothetical protein
MKPKQLLSFPVIAIMLSLLMLSCKQKEQQPNNFLPKNTENLTKEEKQTLDTDTTHKYQYRTGTSGNYDVSGFDTKGKEVSGSVYMEDKQGAGILTISGGEEIEVAVEWTGNGELLATDNQGNLYELTVD